MKHTFQLLARSETGSSVLTMWGESESNKQNLQHKTRWDLGWRRGWPPWIFYSVFSNQLKVNQGHTCLSTIRHSKTFQNDFYSTDSSLRGWIFNIPFSKLLIALSKVTSSPHSTINVAKVPFYWKGNWWEKGVREER